MKKIALFALVSSVVVSAAACSSTQTPAPTGGPAASATGAPTSAPTPTTPPTAAPTPTTKPTTAPPEPPAPACNPPAKPGELFALSATTLVLNRTVSMCDYRGKVMLIVNVASFCGNTPQYEGLQNLYKRYGAQGLVVLGFPTGEFGEQEFGTAQEIKDFCENTYKVEFPMFEKTMVNGPTAHPIYKWLKSQGPAFSAEIEWNFAKFLVGRDGKVVKRYLDSVDPEAADVVADINAELAKR